MINIKEAFKDLLASNPLLKDLTPKQKDAIIKTAQGLDDELSKAFDQILGKY